jgi:hypothetical protein
MNEKNNKDRGFLKGIRLSAFLDCYQEWHALVEGFCEVLCPWPPRTQPTQETQQTLNSEYHYYVFGRALGVIAWLIIAKIIQEVFF